MRISARKLLTKTVDEVWKLLRGSFILVFDDGEIETNHYETAYSRIFWEFHLMYPKLPLLTSQHFKVANEGKSLGSASHRKILDNIVWMIYDIYKDEGITLEIILRQTTLLNNYLYNYTSVNTSDCMISISIEDFIEVLEHPEVVESQKDLHLEPKDTNRVRNQAIIDNVTNTLERVLKDPTKLPNNVVSKIVRAGLVREGQTYQALGVRGYLTDISSDIFPYPIMTGLVKGMNKFHDVFIESRSAAKALMFTKQPLQDSEYFSRRVQVVSQPLRNIHAGDCGSTKYITAYVRDKKFLGIIKGKHYLDPETGVRGVVTTKLQHLIGKRIHLRSHLYCNHIDPEGCCETCFGEMAMNIPPRTNLGQATATSFCADNSQNVMSTKHYDGSSVVDAIYVDIEYKPYVRSAPDENSYLLSKNLLGKNFKLIISSKEAIGLTDITAVPDVENLMLNHVSEINYIGFQITTKGMSEIVPVPVSIGKRLSSLSYEFLRYAKRYGWETNEDQNYVFNMENWDYDDPLLTMPFRHYNMSDHLTCLENVIESRMEDFKHRKTVSLEHLLWELCDVANSKLAVNICVLESIVLATANVSHANKNYRIPKGYTTAEPGVLANTIFNRSLSGAMAYQDHQKFLTNPSSFFNRGRPSHVMDLYIMPKEAVNHFLTHQVPA